MSAITAIATTELAAIRDRLAAAEAVIAALPRCDDHPGDQECCRPATRETHRGPVPEHDVDYWCDEHQPTWGNDTVAAAPLRAYLALVEAGK